MTATPHELLDPQTRPEEPQLRDLFLFDAANQRFGIFAEEVEGTAEAKHPTPLPRASAAVLGIVYVRGRMLTLLDPSALVSGEPSTWTVQGPAVLSLKGDEQLALAADSLGETITISSSDIESPAAEGQAAESNAVFGILLHGGEKITVLNKSQLFSSAVQRKERRRRRF